jgi:zinc/manganese transport system substrate-binding protein
MRSRAALFAIALAGVLAASPAAAQTIKAVASFSILADLVRQVGGARVDVASLVGPNGDAHVYAPSPTDAKKVADAQVVFVNGLGFEGWIPRLVKASGTKAAMVIVSQGVKPLKMEEEGHAHTDPHAWQSIANAKLYVANIREGLAKADPAGASVYTANASAYLAQLDALEAEVKATIAKIALERRRIITSHDAFGYFAAAYGMEFIAPAGVSTEAEASAKDVAKIIAQIRRQKIPAVFLENVSDPRLMREIARETGAKIGGTVYSDALSDKDGPAGTYLDMMRNNLRAFAAALM